MPGRPNRGSFRGTSSQPAPKGNRRGVHHGGGVTVKSHRVEIEAKEAEIIEELAAAAPVRGVDGGLPSHDVFAVRLLATEMVRYANMTAYSYDYGLLDDNGEPRQSLLDLMGKTADRILRLLTSMGMTPASRAKLGLDLVRQASLSEAMSEPNRRKRMRMLRELGVVEGEEAADYE
jgi:hypothetical protein